MDNVERKRPRGGTFLNLFDWPGKSRKKLFSSNTSQLSEESKQAKENVQNPSITRHNLFDVDETVVKNSTFNPRSDSSCCASSVISDDGNVVKPPSVVARLMGLEGLPLPNASEQRVSPDLDPYFLRSSRQATTWDANVEHHSDFDGISWDHLDSRTSKGPRKRMIERFQTETLPPRSAKPISVTHNKLLSPIRNPGFVQSRNPAYVMEAASRMIEQSPRMTARTRVASSSDCASPVPLRIRDLKEKLEAAQKASSSVHQISNDTRNNKYLRGDQNQKKTTVSGKSTCDGFKGEVKPPSFSAQANASTKQKQDSLTTSSSGNKRTSSGQKEKADAKNRAVKSQNSLKGSSLSTGKNVLKQNYQKQNCRDNQQQQSSRKVLNKVVNKVLVESSGSKSKSPGFTMSSAEKSTSSHKKTLPRNKKPRNGVQESGIYEDKRIKRGEKSIKCNISIDDGGSNTSRDDQKRDMDVISFTFSSSIKGLSSHTKGTKLDPESAVKFNVIGGDSLNALLEKKLRELTSKIESSSSSLIQEESLSSTSKDIVSWPSKHGESTQNSFDKVLTESESVSDCTSIYNNQKNIHGEEHEVSSISTLTEANDFGLSCSKSFSDCRQNREYCMKQSLSDQELTWFSSNESHQTLDETYSSKQDWELEYITEILNSGQVMFQDFALRTTTNETTLVLPLSLFDEMERSQGGASMSTTKVERKTLFDCVNQCLALRFERILLGSCKGMMKMPSVILLAEELSREVKGRKKMREMMIDELVENDMSCFEGRWVGFEREMFEQGIDIEREIVSTLLDDLVTDLFSLYY
ncbi:unnamed protein product [Cochlearia groenlandica]